MAQAVNSVADAVTAEAGAEAAANNASGSVLNANAAANAAAASEAQAQQMAVNSASSATTASAAADRAWQAPVRLKVSKDNTKLNETASEFNFIGQGVVVKQPQSDKSIFDVEIPGQQPVSVADVSGLQSALDGKEPALGVPASDYMVLASKTDGSRYWIAQIPAGNGALLAGKAGTVQRPINDMQLGAGLEVAINGQTCTISCEVSKAELDAIQAKVTGIYAQTESAWNNAFNAALAGYVARLSAVEASASASEAHLSALQSEADSNKQLVSQLSNQIINRVESRVNAGAKTITLTYKNGSSVIDTDLIDISGMFATQPPPGSVSVWYGFTGNKPMSAADIKQGATEIESVIVGKDIVLTRAESAQKFMYIWIPDSLGPITGFSFNHAFLDVWQAQAIAVDGVPGKAYISDNKTSSMNVSFEVQ